MMCTIVKVVQMYHWKRVMHWDFKPEHFLFVNKNENSPLKVIDFEMSTFFKPSQRFFRIVESLFYMAPKVFNENYRPEMDIWSVGVIMYILLCERHPFHAITE